MQAKPIARKKGIVQGWDAMSETLQQFIVRRRGELDAEASRLKLELLSVEAEREKVDKVAMMFADEPASEPNEALVQAFAGRSFAGHTYAGRSPRRVSEATIKEMVLKILDEDWGSGLSALDILAHINKRVGVEYPRTSLSPQLSRLKAEGKIHREGRLWIFGAGPDDGQPEDGDEETEQADPTPQNASAPHPQNL